jgi:phosphate:Na+ symporter
VRCCGSSPAGSTALTPIEEVAQRLSDEARVGREQLLGDIALQRTPAATARGAIDALAWADGALHHAWRLAESLRVAAGD